MVSLSASGHKGKTGHRNGLSYIVFRLYLELGVFRIAVYESKYKVQAFKIRFQYG